MDINEMKAALAEGTIQEKFVKKYTVQVEAAEFLAKDMHKKIQDAELNKKLRSFLESSNFVNTLYNIICHANSAIVGSQKHLSTTELKELKNENLSLEEYINICEKLRIGMQDILSTSKELDYNTILFQGLFVYYMDNLSNKLENNHN